MGHAEGFEGEKGNAHHAQPEVSQQAHAIAFHRHIRCRHQRALERKPWRRFGSLDVSSRQLAGANYRNQPEGPRPWQVCHVAEHASEAPPTRSEPRVPRLHVAQHPHHRRHIYHRHPGICQDHYGPRLYARLRFYSIQIPTCIRNHTRSPLQTPISWPLRT
jgi:hypothetical protein